MIQYPTINPQATGNRIKELRKENNIKVCDIADYMGFESQQAIYKWQRGESLPTVDNLYALSRLFGTTIDSILVGCEEEEESSSCHFKGMTSSISARYMILTKYEYAADEIHEKLVHEKLLKN